MEVGWYLNKVRETLSYVSEQEVRETVDEIVRAYRRKSSIFVIGNGGSAANASHFAQDLAKGVLVGEKEGETIRALSLTDNVSSITAIANDDGYEKIFENQLRFYAKDGDVLIAISGSGNSKNVLNAVRYAKANGLVTIAVTGYDGGPLRQSTDKGIHVPLKEMCTAESIHLVVFHLIIHLLRERLTGRRFDESCFERA
jgi:D-sedoheptulose 7-phosphate isomerase